MKFRRRLQNPFILVSQGFLVGAVLFFASLHESGEARAAPSAGSDSPIGASAASR